MLRVYDTAARAKVDFVPRKPGHVSMYVCGPTPYDAPHLGHGRKEIVFDTMRRYLEYDLSPYANIGAYLERVEARPAYRKAIELAGPDARAPGK